MAINHDDVGGAEVFSKGTWFIEGVYPIVQVEQIIEKVSGKTGHDLEIFEFAILESHVEERPAGSRAAVVYDFAHKPIPGMVRGTLAAIVADGDVEKIDGKVSALAVSTAQPFTGRLVRIDATRGKEIPDQPGEFYANLSFTPIDEETQKKAAELRAAAGFRPLGE